MRQCSLCLSQVPNFLPLPDNLVRLFNRLEVDYSLEDFETLNVGQYSCPSCGAADRERLYALFVRACLQWDGEQPMRILDIAPAPALSHFLSGLAQVHYRSADLCSPLADDQVDITDMALYADASFDFILCSHVLEHVPDDAKAIAELYRVLAPGGAAILMVPILLGRDATDEDPAVDDVNERWRRFGQDDHVRMYAREDYLARLRRGGFEVLELDSATFGEGVFRQHGITEQSVLYIGRKTESRNDG